MDLVELAGEVEGHAVGQVTAVGQVHAHDPVAGPQDAEVGGHVRLGATVRLDVDVLGTGIERQRALLGESLGDIHVLAAAVVALARQAFGVLVGQPRTLGFHDRGRDVVLAGDQLDVVVLATALTLHRLPQVRVCLRDRLERRDIRGRDAHVAPTPSVCGPRRVSSHEPTAGHDEVGQSANVRPRAASRPRMPSTAFGPTPCNRRRSASRTLLN